jgi:hypothetical protein
MQAGNYKIFQVFPKLLQNMKVKLVIPGKFQALNPINNTRLE